MQVTLIISAFIQLGLYIILCYNNVQSYYLLVGALINCILLCRIFAGFGIKYTMTRLARGQVLPLYLYSLWLTFYPQHEHLYQIPILLSCIGKTYLLFSTPEDLWIDAVENLIVLQSQTQLFIAVYHLLKLSANRRREPFDLVFEYFLFLAIMKLKFEIHYGTRRAYEQIHFSLDRCSKNFKIRPFYHLIQRVISNLGGDWHHTKIITY